MDSAQISGEIFETHHFKEHKFSPHKICVCKDSLSFLSWDLTFASVVINSITFSL